MGNIKPLPEAVCSTMRSAVVLYDLTRVVEELVFNSLDAAASKVSVFLSLGSSYVKVVDDGSGISRDGLVLLGERYVTSKLSHLADLDAATMPFGFQGEALASISGVALVEISTKAYGKPNGYRKVIKGSNCLYLGIDDERKDVGTTVVVHDLFYNQPVRKKHMLSSPKKVLDSVKKCVFRIALVHPMVYFTVTDLESEDELLNTHPSSSPLTLLMSGFGIEDSTSLHELKATHGSLKLSGYIYGLYDTFSVKAVQYVYINSRFVCKGHIHKLLNSDFESLDPQNTNNWTKKGKRSRSQLLPSYIVNISCPQSFYDLTFESSKTFVEFKDWEPIQTLTKKAIQHLRRKNICCVDGLVQAETLKNDVAEDFSDDGPSIRKSRTEKYQPSSLEKLTTDYLFLMDHEDIPLEECHGNSGQFEDEQNDLKLFHWNNYPFRSWDDSLAKGTSLVNQKSACHLLTSNNYLEEDYFLENRFTASGRSNCHVTESSISSKFGNASPMAESGVTSGTVTGVFPFASQELCNDLQFRKNINKPFLQSCSSQRNLLQEREIFEKKKGIESPIDSLKPKDKQVWENKRFNMMGVDFRDVVFDDLSTTMWQDGGSCAQFNAELMKKGEIPRNMDVLTRGSMKSLMSFGDASIEGNSLLSDSVTLEENSGFGYQSLSSEWCSVTSNMLEQFNYKKANEVGFKFKERTNFGHSSDSEDRDNLFDFGSISKSSSQEKFIYNYPDTGQEIDCIEPSGDFCRFLPEYNQNHKFSPQHFNVEFEVRDCVCSYPNINECKRQRDWCQSEDFEQNSTLKERSRRSQSAPPFYKHKRRFISLHHYLQTSSGEATSNEVNGPFTSAGTSDKEPPKKSKGMLNLCFQPSLGKNRSNTNNEPDMVFGTITQKGEDIDIGLPHFQEGPELVSTQVFNPKENQDPASSLTKWRNGFAKNTVGSNSNSCDSDNEDNIVNIASGHLFLATDSLVPKSIDKKCLRDAKVLQQVDKKFIPIVAVGTLAIIDQHAADERIRLEELRQRVLSGEGNAITYLDTEQELILPEIEYQLLQNYSEQIRNWGWLCDIHTQGSRSFEKNLNLFRRKSSVVILHAVPCILGVNLSDADLLDFLQQLADTDGSSTIPPSVIRILNSKACRGAIMFGDPLLPSECSLIVEELKQTSLCFQCAHGRPTTVPIVNLEALHRQIDKMQLMEDGPTVLWHGLCRHRISLERARLRLNAAAT